MRNRFILLICLATLISLAGMAQSSYAVVAIPEALLKNASVIKRTEDIRYEITEGNKASFYQKVAYTILDEQGDRWATHAEWYDKLRSVESFEGSLYDASGKKIRSIKKGEIKDVSGNDDASLADDNRVKWHSFFYKVYPFTVEYETEIRFKGTMFSPDWIPQQKGAMSVQHSRLTVLSPVSNPLRYKMFNYKGEPVVAEVKQGKSYTWEVKDLPAIKEEFAAPSWHEITTSVFLATEKFVLEDYQGSNASWKDFGKFVYDLKKERDELPEEVKQKVRQLTSGVTEDKEKVRRLYEYMQQNTRYISIQLGVGGWQPFDAKYVASKRYGDCKALSNYMFALLKEAGIRSVYTVIGSGNDNDYLMVDLPSSQFNHAILFVPQGKDTVWLECTSQTNGAGYLGGNTGNRYALAVDENGGALVRTPHYGMNENLQIRSIKATLAEDGTLLVKSNTHYSGMQQDNIHGLINNLSKDKVKEYLHEELDFATYDVNQFNYSQDKSILPVIDETLEITVSNYATVTGKRLFIVPNIMNKTYRKLSATDERKYDIDLGFEYKDVDSVEIELPKGYEPEAMPQPVSISSQFGKYSNTVKLAGNKLIYYRSIEQYSGRFPAKTYPDLVKYYDAVYKADRSRVVLVRNEQPLKGF
ncbi:MAG: DUF3857 domain-containing protein [Chitinophagaceae bacterium]|nr:DUF3857 domain-containing protein [Chitinophagaceae bacterium]